MPGLTRTQKLRLALKDLKGERVKMAKLARMAGVHQPGMDTSELHSLMIGPVRRGEVSKTKDGYAHVLG